MVHHTKLMKDDYKTLIRLLFDICLLKKGPQDLNLTEGIKKGVFICYLLAGTGLLSIDGPLDEAIIKAFIEALMLMFFMFSLLAFYSFPKRFGQSMTAIFGTGALLSVISLPFMLMLNVLHEKQSAAGLVGLAVFLLVCWSFAVMGHIIREATQTSLTLSLLLTFCYLYLSYQFINLIYPLAA
mgnify:FL=1